MNAQQIAAEAKKTGIVWLGGEMEFPANEGPRVAHDKAVEIAEACGYVVSWQWGFSRSSFTVTGGNIPGYAVLDWFDASARDLVKIEIWRAEAGYLK
jgi:hypothetical protein